MGVADRSIDLVLASDVLPYLVQWGPVTLERHLSEVERVLVPEGHLAIRNFSRCGDHEREKAELGAAPERNGLEMVRTGVLDFGLRDAATFLLREP